MPDGGVVETMAIGGLISGSSNLLGGYFSNKSAKKQQRAYNDIYSQQLARQNQALSYLDPYTQSGGQALNTLTGLLTGQQRQDNGSFSSLTPEQRNNLFYQSPDYQFALDQGQKAINRQAAQGGYSYSGRALQEAGNYASGLASQNYNNYINSLMGLTGVGQNASMGQANVLSGFAPSLSQLALGGSVPGFDWGQQISNTGSQIGNLFGLAAGMGWSRNARPATDMKSGGANLVNSGYNSMANQGAFKLNSDY
jgi:hypothetical protein